MNKTRSHRDVNRAAIDCSGLSIKVSAIVNCNNIPFCIFLVLIKSPVRLSNCVRHNNNLAPFSLNDHCSEDICRYMTVHAGISVAE